MTLNDMVQIGIVAVTGTGVWLVGRPDSNSYKRWGYVLGLAGQPMWLYTSWNTQWGIFVVSLFCTYGWFSGLLTYWRKPKKVQPENPLSQ